MNEIIQQQAETCANLMELRLGFGAEKNVNSLTYQNIIAALEQFMECVRYVNTRRSTGTALKLEDESNVQDALYLMLRPWITDLIYENPTDKIGNRYSLKDFLTKSARTVIEAKFIRDKQHGKFISRELHDDIEIYRQHPSCEHLIFFIYDPNTLIPDTASLGLDINSPRNYDGHALYCHLIVKP